MISGADTDGGGTDGGGGGPLRTRLHRLDSGKYGRSFSFLFWFLSLVILARIGFVYHLFITSFWNSNDLYVLLFPHCSHRRQVDQSSASDKVAKDSCHAHTHTFTH